MEYHDWSLVYPFGEAGAKGSFHQQTADTFEIDIDQQRLFVKYADQSTQLLLDIPVKGWSEQTLVLFLDRQVRDKSIGPRGTGPMTD
jgi:type III restriction enzyme